MIEIISDDCGVQVEVEYDYEVSQSQMEECHGMHEVGQRISVDLSSVLLIVGGTGMDILPMLNKKQRDFIIDQLAA